MSTIPVTIIGGFLGAGKTTLLNRLLSESQEGGHGLRLAVIVNDFGALNVDAALIARREGETIALTNGCICCGMADGFTRTLYRLAERADEFDGIVVETSGVADPAQTAAFATLPGFRPAGVIVLADGERVRRLAADPLMGRSISRQLAAADIIVVTKGDLIGPERAEAVADWIRGREPGARVLVCPAGEAPIGLLFDVQPRVARPTVADEAHVDYERALARPRVPVAEGELRRWYAALPEGVLRVKGWLRLAEAPGAPVLVQGVGSRLALSPAGPDAPEPPVLILLGVPGALAGVAAPDGTALERD